MIRNILVGLDGGLLAERSLAWLKSLAPLARLTLLRAYVPIIGGSDPWMDDPALLSQMNNLATKRIQEYLQRIASRLQDRPKLNLRIGSGAGALLEAAGERRYDLIAVTTHGGHNLKRRLIGGTIEHLVHHSSIPLFVVPVSPGARAGGSRIRRIAVPLDGSKSAESVLPLAVGIARDLHAELLLVHVFEGLERISWNSGIWAGGLPEKSAADRFKKAIRSAQEFLRDRMEKLAGSLEKKGVRARPVFANGDCPEALLGAVSQNKGDLIAMCVHGHGALQHLLHGSMTSKILQTTRVPVLLTRDDKLKQRPRST